MSSFYQSLIEIISKPSEDRRDDELQMILSWFLSLFRNRSSVFGDIKPGNIKINTFRKISSFCFYPIFLGFQYEPKCFRL